MKSRELRVLMGQMNPIAGDIKYNAQIIIEIINSNKKADLIILPEMALVGYPLMDHILDPIIRTKNKEYIEKITKIDTDSTIILGTFTEPEELKEKVQRFYNSAIVIKNKKIVHIEHKRLLPNYDIFDERRYFSFDEQFEPIDIKGVEVGILICEDIWDDHYEVKVAENLVRNGAEFLVVINASPYHVDKFEMRKQVVSEKSKKFQIPIAYINMVGGLDEIVYDGQSFITNKFGQIIFRAKAFKEENPLITLKIDETKQITKKKYPREWRKEIIEALTLNLYDYFHKSNIFEGIVLGLSGGIDSAFTSYICAKAIGPEKVTNIMMPTRYTSQQSIDLARQLCKNLNSPYIIHPIDEVFQRFEASLENKLGKLPFDVADENLQARIRANILMYYSNKHKWLLVSTGNKSEIAVGFCTLYGDTCGGKNIPGDLLKVQIYDICEWINREEEIIPKGIITRAPTAELRENQKDSDALPPYNILDRILKEILECGIGADFTNLKEEGINEDTIRKVQKLYLNSEFKRRQLVQSVKVSASAFGIGRRYPVLKKINL